MPRRRIAVALLPPPSLAAEVDAFRRAVSSSSLATVPPHVTLVPPVNVPADGLPATHASVRRAAVAVQPFTLVVGRGATFLPDTPTLHLEVRGEGPADAARLTALRDGLRHGPLDRPDTWPYMPHLTLEEASEPTRIEAGLLTLAGYRARWFVDRVHVLEQRRPDGTTARWVPIAEEPLGRPAIVGRGGVELTLRTLRLLDEDAAALLASEPVGPELDPARPPRLVVVADAEGAVVGAASGVLGPDGTARLDDLAVAGERRREGIGGQVLRAWCSDAADGGAVLVVVPGEVPAAAAGFLERHGFAAAAGVLVRRP